MTVVTDDLTSRIAQSTDEWRRQLAEMAATGRPHTFDVRTPLLKQGRTNLPLAATDKLSVVLKCYAQGGENALHAHPYEDHVFLILQGRAEFRGPGGEVRVLGANQGIMLPAGSLYRFEAQGEENLVLLRIGTTVVEGEDPLARIDEDGQPFDGYSEGNREVEIVFDEGRTFG